MTRITCVRAFAVPGLLAVALICSFSSPAFADAILSNGNIGIKVDENCNGSITGFGSAALPCNFQNDPGPGGLPGVMTYNMLNPPGLVAGDVLLFDADAGTFLDVIRCNRCQNFGPRLLYSD